MTVNQSGDKLALQLNKEIERASRAREQRFAERRNALTRAAGSVRRSKAERWLKHGLKREIILQWNDIRGMTVSIT